MVSAFFILILGLIDDCNPLSPKFRIIIQTVIILITIELTELKFDTLGHSFGSALPRTMGMKELDSTHGRGIPLIGFYIRSLS